MQALASLRGLLRDPVRGTPATHEHCSLRPQLFVFNTPAACKLWLAFADYCVIPFGTPASHEHCGLLPQLFVFNAPAPCKLWLPFGDY
jgi:hypothetical protein